VQLLGLFLIQVDELNSKAKPVMVVANLALQIEPISVRKQHAKSHDFAPHDFAYCIEITTAFREIGYARRVAFLATVPNRIEAHAQTWFRSSFIHAPSIIEFFDEVEKGKSNPGGVLVSTLRISAFLCDSAVILLYSIFTAETTKNAEIAEKILF